MFGLDSTEQCLTSPSTQLSGLKDEKWIEKQTYMKTETCRVADSILESFEYFCQISSKLILIPFQSWCIFEKRQASVVTALVHGHDERDF